MKISQPIPFPFFEFMGLSMKCLVGLIKGFAICGLYYVDHIVCDMVKGLSFPDL